MIRVIALLGSASSPFSLPERNPGLPNFRLLQQPVRSRIPTWDRLNSPPNIHRESSHRGSRGEVCSWRIWRMLAGSSHFYTDKFLCVHRSWCRLIDVHRGLEGGTTDWDKRKKVVHLFQVAPALSKATVSTLLYPLRLFHSSLWSLPNPYKSESLLRRKVCSMPRAVQSSGLCQFYYWESSHYGEFLVLSPPRQSSWVPYPPCTLKE